MSDCPPRDQLALLLAERLSGPEAERVEAHVQSGVGFGTRFAHHFSFSSALSLPRMRTDG
jgi:hypothetical protein